MKTTMAARPATTASATTAAMWAVLDQAGRVVIVFGGGEAHTEALRWRGRGYRIAELLD